MKWYLIGTILILAASGCRYCQCTTDYLPPVLDGPYSPGMRAGSAVADSSAAQQGEMSEQITSDPDLVELPEFAR